MDDLAHVCFRDVSWLQANGGALGRDNALEYFAQSQFYDRTCNNEVLKMQARFTGATAPALDQLRYVGPLEG
jgi:mediator of RNA polymerase II transcription subunit 6